MANAMFENKGFGVRQVILEAPNDEQKGDYIKVSASELRLDDEFMKHEPRTDREKYVKEGIQRYIESGPKDFWCLRHHCQSLFSEEFIKDYGMAYIAVITKSLVASGKSVEEAWDMMCKDSGSLGAYQSREHAVPAWSNLREVCGFYNLANTSEILGNRGNGAGCLVLD